MLALSSGRDLDAYAAFTLPLPCPLPHRKRLPTPCGPRSARIPEKTQPPSSLVGESAEALDEVAAGSGPR